MLFTKKPNTTFLYVIHGSGQGQYNVIDTEIKPGITQIRLILKF